MNGIFFKFSPIVEHVFVPVHEVIQFFFIKPLNEIAEKKIKKMDFKQLAARNTSTPGFGKGDFVSYYNEIDI